MMRVAVDDGFDVVEAIDWVAQPLRAEILEDRLGLALDRPLDRGVVEYGHAALGAQGAELVLELARLVQRLVDEQLGDRLAEGRELAAAVAAHEAFDAGKADTVDFDRLLVEHLHAGALQDLDDLFRLAA